MIESGENVIVVDNLSNSRKVVLERIKELTGVDVMFYEKDLVHRSDIKLLFQENEIDAIIHFGALKAVGDL